MDGLETLNEADWQVLQYPGGLWHQREREREHDGKWVWEKEREWENRVSDEWRGEGEVVAEEERSGK